MPVTTPPPPPDTRTAAPRAPMPPGRRTALIAGSVLVFHGLAIWALQSGLLRRAVEVVVPVALLAEIIEPTPVADPPPAPPPPPKTPPPKKLTPPPPPQLAARPELPPAPAAPVGVIDPPPPPPVVEPTPPAPPAPPAPPPAPPAPPKIELPSSDADYLANPKPAYPPISKRLGEQGKVVVRVLIGVDGMAQRAEVRSSSGYERLDKAAYDTVLRWRYVPGKRNGQVEAMWFNVPINFVLE